MKAFFFLFLLFPCLIDKDSSHPELNFTLLPQNKDFSYSYVVKSYQCFKSFRKCDFSAEFKVFDSKNLDTLSQYQINTNIKISIELRFPNIFHLKIKDDAGRNFQTGHANYTTFKETSQSKFLNDYRFVINLDPFNVKVISKVTMEVVFAFSHINFLFAENFVQFKVMKPQNPYIFGIGQRFGSFQIGEGIYTIWNQDNPENVDNPYLNEYGSHPVYLAREESLNYHILFLRNINAMQIALNSNTLEYKLMGGTIDLSLIFGDRFPDTAICTYHSLIGGTTLHPFWSMGFFQSRFGYMSFQELVQIVEEYKSNRIPLDGLFLDLEYMKHRSTFTVNKQLYDPQIIKEVKKKYKLKLIPIIDPLVNVDDLHEVRLEEGGSNFPSRVCEKDVGQIGLEYNVFLKNADGTPFMAKQWVDRGYIPDFTHPNSTSFYEEMLVCLYDIIPFDGIWLDMNEVSLYETERNSKFFPFLPFGLENGPMHNTIETKIVHFNGEKELDIHNLYGYHQASATRTVLKNLLQTSFPFILSRSNVFGMGAIAQHWSGDNTSNFKSLVTSLSLLFSMGLFGLPMTGSDICGHNGHSNPYLCARWIQLGAFYPFSRNHNNDRSQSQHFTVFGETVIKSARINLAFRYSLLKYIYSLFLEQRRGGTIIKPLFFVFPEFDEGLEQNVLKTQMMLGKMIMIGVMGESDVREFFLPGGMKWFYFNQKKWVERRVKVRNEADELAPVFIREGSVVMRQRWGGGTVEELGEKFKMNVFLEMDQENHQEEMHSEQHGETHLQAKGMIIGIGDLREQNIAKYCWEEEDNCLVDFDVKARFSQRMFQVSVRFKWRNNGIPERVKRDGEKFISIEQINLYGLFLTNPTLSLNFVINGVDQGKVRTIKVKKGKCWQVKFEKPVVFDGDGEIELKI